MMIIIGMLLIDTARDSSMNVLIESSGRDITMFDYMNYCFPSDHYHRLVVHFTIDDIRFAEKSVDRRMLAEMEAGRRSILDEGDNDILVMIMIVIMMIVILMMIMIIIIVVIVKIMMIMVSNDDSSRPASPPGTDSIQSYGKSIDQWINFQQIPWLIPCISATFEN